MAVEIDASAWPVVVLRGQGKVDAAGASDALSQLEEVLDRAESSGERVGLVQDLERLDRAASEMIRAWWTTNFERLGRNMVAAASVVAPATVDRNRRLIEESSAMYPFPTWCAATTEECTAWVSDQM